MSEFPKPHKTEILHGIPVVKEIVCKEVKQVLYLMHDNPGSYIRRDNMFNFATLFIPDQPPIRIEQGFIIPILEYCTKSDNYIADYVSDFTLCRGAIAHIKIYSQS